jgi:protein associated with RNAse G/E
MKTIKIAISLFLLIFLQEASAQQKKGGIFYFHISMNDSLNRDTFVMTDQLSDSLKSITEAKMEKILNAEVECIYWRNKKGKIVNNGFAFTINESLPFSSFKRASKNYEMDYYIKIYADLQVWAGTSIHRNNRRHSNMRPAMNLNVQVYDKEKKIVWSKKVTNSNFSNMYYEMEAEADERVLLWRLLSPKRNNPDRFEKTEIMYMFFKTLEMVS